MEALVSSTSGFRRTRCVLAFVLWVTRYGHLTNCSGSTSACFKIARRVPSGMSPEWFGIASRLTVELEAKLLQSAHDFTISESGEPTHSSGHHDCEVLILRRWGQG